MITQESIWISVRKQDTFRGTTTGFHEKNPGKTSSDTAKRRLFSDASLESDK